jgi:hypothetical protein
MKSILKILFVLLEPFLNLELPVMGMRCRFLVLVILFKLSLMPITIVVLGMLSLL